MKDKVRTLYGIPVGPYVRKVSLALRLKGLDCETVSVMPGDASNAAFSAISPLLKVPAFSDGDLNLADSSVICEYLDEAYPDIAIYPRDPRAKAQARWLEEYADTKVLEVCGRGIFFQRVVKPAMMQEAADDQAVQDNIDNAMPSVLNYLELQAVRLIGVRAEGPLEKSYLFGELSVPDLAIATHFLNAQYAGFTVDCRRWPQFASYLQRVYEHRVFVAEVQEYSPMMEGLLERSRLVA